jgi:hypothetical protein
LLIVLFIAKGRFVGGPGSPTADGSRAVTDGGIKVSRWVGTVDAAEEKAGMTIDSAKLTQERDALHATAGPATMYWMNDALASDNGAVVASYDKAALVTDGKLKSTDGLYGLRFASDKRQISTFAFEEGIENTTKCPTVRRQGLFRCAVSAKTVRSRWVCLGYRKINVFAISLVATKAIQ